MGPNRGSTLSTGSRESRCSHLRSAASFAIQKGASAVSEQKSIVITLMNLHQTKIAEEADETARERLKAESVDAMQHEA